MPRMSGATRWLAEAEQGAPAAVEETIKLLGKAARAHQLYLHNNPTYQRALELARAAFQRLWSQLDELVLTVTESALVWDDRLVYQEPDRPSDTLPWLLYKDGVRELRLLPGIEGAEVERFLEVLLALRRRGAGEDDAVTLLWDGDFSFLRYRYIEAQEGDAASLAVGATPGRLDGAGAPPPPAPMPGVVDLKEFDGTLYFLAEHELQYLHGQLAREYATDLRTDVVAMLLDVFELQASRTVRAEICTALEQLVPLFLAGGHFRSVATLLREVGITLERVPVAEPEHRQRLAALAEQLSVPEAIAQLVVALEAAATPPSEAELTELLGQLRPAALAPLLRALEGVQGVRIRTALRVAADRLAMANTAELVRLVASDEPGVAREAVTRAGALRLAAAVPALGALLAHAEGDSRLRAVEALAQIATPGALEQLATVVDDESRDVRLLALRALAQTGFRGALPRLEGLVKDRRGRDADLTEMMALFEAYGASCGDAGVPLLDGMLNGRSLLGRRPDSQLRACAAMALGRIGTPRATQALSRAVDEKDVVVRTAVQRAGRALR